jgi:Na+-driven multidrug efflux pump
MQLNKFIGDRNFYSTALRIAVPIMIQEGITNFVNLLDNIMVGRMGTMQMSGVAIVNLLMFVFNLSIFGSLSGAGLFGAQFYGADDMEGVRHTLRFKIIISILITAAGTLVFLYFGKNLISAFLNGEGAAVGKEETLDYALRYLRIMLLGLPPLAISMAYATTLRETGETVLPMKASIAGVFVNLVGDYLLIFGHFGFPKLGVEGAAIATVVSRYIQAGIEVIWTHANSKKNQFAKGLYSSMKNSAQPYKRHYQKRLASYAQRNFYGRRESPC